MLRITLGAVSFLLLLAVQPSVSAQLTPLQKDPLTPPQSNVAACSVADASSCAQTASKILPLIMGPSPMEENLRRLMADIGNSADRPSGMSKTVEWAAGAFRTAGIEVHTEKYRSDSPDKAAATTEAENVIGEIRGYEKPDEVVILGAHLNLSEQGTPALDSTCNSALVIEAARALKSTGLLPRRTIRFVLFAGKDEGDGGAFEYVKTHKAELDKTRAVIAYAGMGRVEGYSLGGRRDIEAGVRDILKPLESWDVDRHTFDASPANDSFDFLLEGVPTLVPHQKQIDDPPAQSVRNPMDKLDMREQKLRTVLAALTAWGIADRTEPLGKRLLHGEIEAQIKETGLDQQMKALGYWDAWQSGARGRMP
jgi:hypothetical protein